MNLRKAIAAFLALVMVSALLAGCGGKPQNGTAGEKTGEPAQTSSQESKATDTAAVKEEPITLKMFYGFAGGDIPNKENDTLTWLAEKTGVTIDVDYLVGDLKTKVGVMIASADYPDLIWGHEEHQKFVDAGACIPLDEYIEKSGDNVKKAYGEKLKAMKKDDGHIYYLSNQREDVDISRANMGFYLQKAVLKEFGWPKPKTLDEYFDLIEKYMKKYPKIDGKDTIGFEILTHEWRFFCLQNPPSYLLGHPNDGGVLVDPSSYEAKTYGTHDVARKYYKKLNEAYLKGIIDRECFAMNYDTYIAKLSSGRVLGMYDQWWQMDPGQNALKQQKMFDRLYVAFPLLDDPQNMKDQYNTVGSIGTRDGVSISVNCQKPERAFKLMNYMLSDEAQTRIRWGVEGTDYMVDKSTGKFYRTPEQRAQADNIDYRKKTGLGFYVYPWPRTCINAKMADGNFYDPAGDPDEVLAKYQEHDKEVLNAYNIKCYTELFSPAQSNPWGFAWEIVLPDDSAAKTFDTKRNDLQKEYLPQLVMAKQDQFDALWTEYVAEYNKLDAKSYEDFLTKELKKRMEIWK